MAKPAVLRLKRSSRRRRSAACCGLVTMVDVFRTARPPLIIEQVEDALVEHLRVSVSGQCKVEAFPDDPAKYDFANLPAALLIHYAGSQYQSAKGPANQKPGAADVLCPGAAVPFASWRGRRL